MDTVAVPADQLANLTLRWTAYKNASPLLKPYARTLLQNRLNACSVALGRPTTPPEDWAFIVEPDTVSIYPGIEQGSPLALLYPVA
jgi:hypothetical protein